MDFFANDLIVWNGDFAAFFKSIDSDIYRSLYQEIRSKA
jgi:hypothetical protein